MTQYTTKESVEGGYTREKEERKTERRVSTRFEKYWTESGRGDGQGDVEKKDHQLYWRPYMMGKARGKEEEEALEWHNKRGTAQSTLCVDNKKAKTELKAMTLCD